jgi:hypothetical protein
MDTPLHLRQYDTLLINYGFKDEEILQKILEWFFDAMSGISTCYISLVQEELESFNQKVLNLQKYSKKIIAFIPEKQDNIALFKAHHLHAKQSIFGGIASVRTVVLVGDRSTAEKIRSISNNCSVLQFTKPGFELYANILIALNKTNPVEEYSNTANVFVYRPWQDVEGNLADDLCRPFIECGLRLIGGHDFPFSPTRFDSPRLRKILKTCCHFLYIFPAEKFSRQDVATCQGFLDLIKDLAVPGTLLIPNSFEQKIQLPAHDVECITTSNRDIERILDEVEATAARLCQQAQLYPLKEHIFYATNFRLPQVKQKIQEVIQTLSLVRCLIGDEVLISQTEDSVQEDIFKLVASASMVIADITESNINSLIEAGAARGAGVECYLLSSGERHKPPFMFRDRQVFYFDSDIKLLALIHKIVYPHRKQVLNSEILTRLLARHKVPKE